ncbi:MAG: DUF5050 domain-containing protein [Oscillospiraceae bacterium]|nr:DUF5050 domain-containing protein [Oscillospiraceae bacterium]
MQFKRNILCMLAGTAILAAAFSGCQKAADSGGQSGTDTAATTSTTAGATATTFPTVANAPTGSMDSPSGNITNGEGWVASTDGFTYYSTSAGLFCMQPDGTTTQISHDRCQNMIISDGWIYFSKYQQYDLWKMRTDGSEEQQITFLHYTAFNFYVADGWIYYSDSNYQVSKIKTDGTENTVLSSNPAFFITASSGWVYSGSDGPSSGVFIVRTDGTGSATAVGLAAWFTIDNGTLYYEKQINGPGEVGPATDGGGLLQNVGLYKADPDGGNAVKISDVNPFQMLASGDWIYYLDANGSDSNWALCKIRMDGTGNTALTDSSAKVAGFNVAGDWVFFYTWTSTSADSSTQVYYRIHTDGTGLEQLAG